MKRTRLVFVQEIEEKKNSTFALSKCEFFSQTDCKFLFSVLCTVI